MTAHVGMLLEQPPEGEAVAQRRGLSRRRPVRGSGPRTRRSGLGSTGAELALSTPALVLFSALMVLPLGLAVFYSFTDLDIYGSFSRIVGGENYVRLVQDPGMIRAIVVTAVLTVSCTVLVNVVGVALAVLLNRQGLIYSLYRAAIFYPYVVSALITGFVWNAILNPDGAVNSALRALGFPGVPFLTDSTVAVVSLILVTVWNTLGFSVVLYLAGLQTIPTELLEAAEVDGATAWDRFRYVVRPLLGPTVTINVVLAAIGLVRTYDLVVSLTGGGGPAGATQTIAYRIINLGFAGGQAGFASAGSVVLLLITVALVAVTLVLRRRSDAL